MNDELKKLLKEYVNIFINEYSNYLNREQLELLKNINYDYVFDKDNIILFGETFLDKIYLSSCNQELINNLKKMPNYNTYKLNKFNNLSTYLEYMCDNGYDLMSLYRDILMYYLFFLVMPENSSLYKGFINQEINYLNIKYSIMKGCLYLKEEKIASKVTRFFHLEVIRKIMFMNIVDAFKYINDNFGYRYAKMLYEVNNLMEEEKKYLKNNYQEFNDFLEYVNSYDNLNFSNTYDYILDFQVVNEL